MTVDPDDPRWGGCAPWFFRYMKHTTAGDWPTLFSRLSQRLERHFRFPVSGVSHLEYFATRLETESLQRFKYDAAGDLATSLSVYFDPSHIDTESWSRVTHEELTQIQAELDALPLQVTPTAEESPIEATLRAYQVTAAAYLKERAVDSADRESRKTVHYTTIVAERIAVLEALLRILPNQNQATAELIHDVRRFFAETRVILDIKADEGRLPLIVPLEEPLLQRAVIDDLLVRLSAGFPKRARELVDAYHELLKEADGDTIFLNAFKSLEELARELTRDTGFMFDKSHLQKNFPLLHGTIHQTLIRLGGHRGDRAGHGKNVLPPHEIRYLLFTICNAALLLLDYPQSAGNT
jgi:hypothetical protein